MPLQKPNRRFVELRRENASPNESVEFSAQNLTALLNQSTDLPEGSKEFWVPSSCVDTSCSRCDYYSMPVSKFPCNLGVDIATGRLETLILCSKFNKENVPLQRLAELANSENSQGRWQCLGVKNAYEDALAAAAKIGRDIAKTKAIQQISSKLDEL